VFTGEGNNGKSVWSTLIQEILGSENYANQSIQDLSSDKNARAELFGKLANIYADLPAEVIKETGTIKMLTGGDEITAEKKYKDPFTFKNKAKLIFSANQLPPVTDYNEAFFDRVHIVNCPNRFDGDNADPFLLEKLTTEEAKSAWLNHAIKGAKRLLDNKQFTTPQVVEDAVQSYKFSSDSVSEFFHTQIRRVSGSFETKETVYSAYKNWAKSNGRHPVSERKFTRRAKSEPNSVEEFYPQVNNKQRKAWKNIKLTDMSRKKYDSQNFL
jgi:putative DNA primase/helicase